MAVKLTNDLAQKIFLEFCEGELQEDGSRVSISLDALVRKYGVARATLYRRADKENWQQRQMEFISKAREKLTNIRVNDLVKEAEKLDRASLTIANAFLNRIVSKLARAQENERNGIEDTLTAGQLQSLTSAALNAQKIGKLALGEAQEISKVNADVSVPDSFRTVIGHLEEIRKARAESHNATIQ